MLEGGCLCSGIRFRLTGKLGPAGFCHCKQCQRASGSAFAANAPVRSASASHVLGIRRRYPRFLLRLSGRLRARRVPRSCSRPISANACCRRRLRSRAARSRAAASRLDVAAGSSSSSRRVAPPARLPRVGTRAPSASSKRRRPGAGPHPQPVLGHAAKIDQSLDHQLRHALGQQGVEHVPVRHAEVRQRVALTMTPPRSTDTHRARRTAARALARCHSLRRRVDPQRQQDPGSIAGRPASPSPTRSARTTPTGPAPRRTPTPPGLGGPLEDNPSRSVARSSICARSDATSEVAAA